MNMCNLSVHNQKISWSYLTEVKLCMVVYRQDCRLWFSWHWCVFYGRFLAPFWYSAGHDKNLLALVGEYLREILETVFISIGLWGGWSTFNYFDLLSRSMMSERLKWWLHSPRYVLIWFCSYFIALAMSCTRCLLQQVL